MNRSTGGGDNGGDGGHQRDEVGCWIPAEDLDEFDANIVGPVELVAEFRAGLRDRRPAS